MTFIILFLNKVTDKKLHGTYSFNGDHQQQSGRQTTYHHPQETGSDPRRYRRTPQQAKP